MHNQEVDFIKFAIDIKDLPLAEAKKLHQLEKKNYNRLFEAYCLQGRKFKRQREFYIAHQKMMMLAGRVNKKS